jgi:hypothetical protein
MKDLQIKAINIFAVVSFALGLTILILFICRLGSYYTVFGRSPILLAETGQVGDFIGGFIGTIWSFTGILLYFKAINLQRIELHAQRIEFQIDRITNIIYKQLELIERKEQDLTLAIPSRNLNSKGTVVIRNFWIWTAICIDKAKYSELTGTQLIEFDVLFGTVSNVFLSFNKEVDKTLDIIVKLINKNDSKISTLPKADIQQLSLLLYHNMDIENVKPFFQMQIKLFEMEIQKIESVNSTSELIKLFGCEVDRLKNVITKIEIISNACA